MTVIAGIAHKGKVWIGGDSLAADDSGLCTVRADRKVFHCGEYLIGFMDSFRMRDLLWCVFEPPAPPTPTKDLRGFMVREFIPCVRELFKEGGFAVTQDGRESGGYFLAGIRGRLFMIGNDYQVAENLCHYDAIGCGADIALGSLFSSCESGWSPRHRVELALEAAAEFNIGVAPPFCVEVV